MTLRELRYLVALAEYGHLGRAAEACHISQPTLSTQLKKLEDELDVVLFERSNKALHITPIGRKIVDQARRVLAEADAIVELSRETTAPLVGPLTLGVIPTLGPHLLPWLVPLLKGDYPALRLILHEDLTDRLIERLRSHRIDAALLSVPITGPDLEIRPLFDEPFFFACPQDHPLARMRTVRDVDLRRQRLLLLTDGHCLREQALAVCGQREASVEDDGADFRATSLETLSQMVAAGMGSTLLPALAVARPEDQPFAVRSLQTAASRLIGLVWRRAYPKGADLERLAALIRDHLPPAVQAARHR
jgi:LysR family hydrogen peroxide-inducible transcriptional activator